MQASVEERPVDNEEVEVGVGHHRGCPDAVLLHQRDLAERQT